MNNILSVVKAAATSIFGSCLLLAAVNASAGDIRVNFESPVTAQAYQGISNVRGWAISSVGIDKVELFIDGVFITNIPSGGLRNDVGSVFPEFPGSNLSGFSMAYSFSRLAPGPHEFKIRAVDFDNEVKVAVANLTIVGFGLPFVADPNALSFDGSTVTANTNTLNVVDMTFDGQLFDAKLQWRAETQRYQFTSITPK